MCWGRVFHILGQIDQNVSIARDGRLLYGPRSGLTGAARGVGRELWPGPFTTMQSWYPATWYWYGYVLYMYQAQCTLCRAMFIIRLLHYAKQVNIGAQYLV